MFYVSAFAPIIVILVVLTLWASKIGKNYFVFSCAGIGGLLAAATPWVLLWYTSAILKDPTANIGAGILMLGQLAIAPLGSLFGAAIGVCVQAVLTRR